MVSSEFDNMFSKTYFEPTINSFKNAILINYKKVGTRWMGMVGSLPIDFNSNKLQLDVYFSNQPIATPKFKEFYDRTIKNNKLSTELGDVYVNTFFDIEELNSLIGESPRDDLSGFDKFNSTSDFFKYEGVNSWNELLFDNPHKDIVFLIRNPLERYISGCVQILYHMIDEIPNNEQIRNELKFYVNITDSELKNLYKFLRTDDFVENINFSSLNYHAVRKVLKYIVDKRTDLIFQDVHTQNYLKNYVDMIHHIKNKSRIKIIDLSQCSNQTAIKFFDGLRGDTELSKASNTIFKFKESNKPIYKFFIDEYVHSEYFIQSSPRFFVEPEYNTYLQLLNSPHFVDLGE
jgi:hypothetical protein